MAHMSFSALNRTVQGWAFGQTLAAVILHLSWSPKSLPSILSSVDLQADDAMQYIGWLQTCDGISWTVREESNGDHRPSPFPCFVYHSFKYMSYFCWNYVFLFLTVYLYHPLIEASFPGEFLPGGSIKTSSLSVQVAQLSIQSGVASEFTLMVLQKEQEKDGPFLQVPTDEFMTSLMNSVEASDILLNRRPHLSRRMRWLFVSHPPPELTLPPERWLGWYYVELWQNPWIFSNCFSRGRNWRSRRAWHRRRSQSRLAASLLGSAMSPPPPRTCHRGLAASRRRWTSRPPPPGAAAASRTCSAACAASEDALEWTTSAP